MAATAELALEGDAGAVPAARRLTRSALSARWQHLAPDAELVVSELVTNALLYGEPPVTVRITADEVVRIEVGDAGRSAPILLQRNTHAMTGRGLSLVTALCSAWGVQPGPDDGKVVWAELGGVPGTATGRSAPDVDIDALLAAWADEDAGSPVYTVRLGAVATDLLLSAKSHIDNVVREFTLLRDGEASGGPPVPAELAPLIQTVTVDFADARTEIKRQAAAAAQRGDELTELELHLPAGAADAGERYLAALDEADRYARSAHLLTLAPPPVHRIFRRWYVEALVDQIRARSRNETPPSPRSFQRVLADEVSALSERNAVLDRLRLLQDVNEQLATGQVAEELAAVVAESAMAALDVASVRVRLLTESGALRTVAWRGRDGTDADPFADLALDTDHPAADVARRSQPVFIRSLRARFDRVPGLAGFYPPDLSGRIMPLRVGGQTLGVMSLTFRSGELTDQGEVAFAQSLCDALAQALKRAELAASDEDNRQVLSFLADATHILVSASEPSELLERLAVHAVPRLVDWCTIYVADGPALRRVAMVIDGYPELSERLKAAPLSLDVDVPQTRAFRSGKTVLIGEQVGHLLEGMYPGMDFAAIGGDVAWGTGVCIPILLRDQPIGVISVTFVRSGRKVTPRVVEALTGLAERAALAFDNARIAAAQRQVLQTLAAAVLPASPPAVPGWRFAARYLPASGDVAGDWWEVHRMSDETVLVGLGDAAGHGVDAVAQMTELRYAARALAAVEASPASALADMSDRLLEGETAFATAFYGVLHPSSGRLTWARAGHVPPILARHRGTSSLLASNGGLPLGVPRSARPEDQVTVVDPGDLVVLYSDGVVERRGENLDDGIASLVETVQRHRHDGLQALADRIIDLHCSHLLDDCCLLLLQRDLPAGA